MQKIYSFSQMSARLTASGERKRIVVVCPYDAGTLDAVKLAIDNNVAEFIFIGDHRAEEAAAGFADKARISYIPAEGADEAANASVELIRNGKADVLMKGLINTDNFLRAILNKEHGLLPKGALLTHLSVAEMPGYHKLLMFSDVAVIPYPTLEQRTEIIKTDLDVCERLGIETPKVALIHFTEKVNPKFQNSVDYATLIEMGAEGQFGKAILGGPMDVKTACDRHSAEVKGLTSPTCGDADLLIFPNIESGNTFYKTITLFGGAVIAGVLRGPQCPVILPSRSDSAESKYLSMVLACITA